MALLVGSDYTVGVEGIGTVTALEIVAYFSDKSEDSVSEKNIAETLKQFQVWIKNNRNNHALPLMKKLKNISLSECMHIFLFYFNFAGSSESHVYIVYIYSVSKYLGY